MELTMVYHENGGNESFEVRGGHMSTLKAFSDPAMSHNFILMTNTLAFKAGQSARAGLGLEWECAQTIQHGMSGLEPTVMVERR